MVDDGNGLEVGAQVFLFEASQDLLRHFIQLGAIVQPTHAVAPLLGDDQRRRSDIDLIVSIAEDVLEGASMQAPFVRIGQVRTFGRQSREEAGR